MFFEFQQFSEDDTPVEVSNIQLREIIKLPEAQKIENEISSMVSLYYTRAALRKQQWLCLFLLNYVGKLDDAVEQKQWLLATEVYLTNNQSKTLLPSIQILNRSLKNDGEDKENNCELEVKAENLNVIAHVAADYKKNSELVLYFGLLRIQKSADSNSLDDVERIKQLWSEFVLWCERAPYSTVSKEDKSKVTIIDVWIRSLDEGTVTKQNILDYIGALALSLDKHQNIYNALYYFILPEEFNQLEDYPTLIALLNEKRKVIERYTMMSHQYGAQYAHVANNLDLQRRSLLAPLNASIKAYQPKLIASDNAKRIASVLQTELAEMGASYSELVHRGYAQVKQHVQAYKNADSLIDKLLSLISATEQAAMFYLHTAKYGNHERSAKANFSKKGKTAKSTFAIDVQFILTFIAKFPKNEIALFDSAEGKYNDAQLQEYLNEIHVVMQSFQRCLYSHFFTKAKRSKQLFYPIFSIIEQSYNARYQDIFANLCEVNIAFNKHYASCHLASQQTDEDGQFYYNSVLHSLVLQIKKLDSRMADNDLNLIKLIENKLADNDDAQSYKTFIIALADYVNHNARDFTAYFHGFLNIMVTELLADISTVSSQEYFLGFHEYIAKYEVCEEKRKAMASSPMGYINSLRYPKFPQVSIDLNKINVEKNSTEKNNIEKNKREISEFLTSPQARYRK